MSASLQNIYKLGYKEATSPDSYADQMLGVEYVFEDADLLSSAPVKPLKSASRVHAIWVQNTHGSTTFAPGSLVKYALPRRTVNAQAGATEIVDGVVDPYLTTGPAPGERFFIIVKGPIPVLSNGSFSANAGLASSSSGKAASATTGTVTNFGRAIEAASGADQLRRAYVDCRTF